MLVVGVWWISPLDAADGLEVSFDSGRVTVIANDITVTDILTEWEQIGGTIFIDTDDFEDHTLTLALRDVPEGKALQVLLRRATGYVAVRRKVNESGASFFDRVLIMPTLNRITRDDLIFDSSDEKVDKDILEQHSFNTVSLGDPPNFGQTANDLVLGTEDDRELELIESLRNRYQVPHAPGVVFGQAGMFTDKTAPRSGNAVPTAPRPGMIITLSEQPTARSPSATSPRPRVGSPSR